MAIFITGGTGYIGSYVVAGLLDSCDEHLFLLARKASNARAWRALQLHLDRATFENAMRNRITMVEGDLTQPGLGLDAEVEARVVKESTSVIHIAASLNRKSEKSCLNANLRGSLHVIQLARKMHASGGLRRFSHVSTVAVAGRRQDEVVKEDEAIEWDRSDYDPYARTKKFCEYMLAQLLPDVPRTIFRPSVVLGDSRRPQTTQFDMVKAFAFLARIPVLPFSGEGRIDIVPVDYVSEAIVRIHLLEDPKWRIYHLSAGEDSLTYGAITESLAAARGKSAPWFWSWLAGPFSGTTKALASLRGTGVGTAAARLHVFMPYLTFNTVFDNTRVVEALGRKPEPFTDYSAALLEWTLKYDFEYPYDEYTEQTAS